MGKVLGKYWLTNGEAYRILCGCVTDDGFPSYYFIKGRFIETEAAPCPRCKLYRWYDTTAPVNRVKRDTLFAISKLTHEQRVMLSVNLENFQHFIDESLGDGHKCLVRSTAGVNVFVAIDKDYGHAAYTFYAIDRSAVTESLF